MTFLYANNSKKQCINLDNKLKLNVKLFNKIIINDYKSLNIIIKKFLLKNNKIIDIFQLREKISNGETTNHIEFLLILLKVISKPHFIINNKIKHIFIEILMQLEEENITTIYSKKIVKKLSSNTYTYINDVYFQLQDYYLNKIFNKYSYLNKDNDMKLFIDNNDSNISNKLITRKYSLFTSNTTILSLIQKLI